MCIRDSPRTQEIDLRMFVRQHDTRFADQDLGMADASIGTRHTHRLRSAECLFVKLDSGRRAFDGKIRSRALETLWDCFDCVCHVPILHERSAARIVKKWPATFEHI